MLKIRTLQPRAGGRHPSLTGASVTGTARASQEGGLRGDGRKSGVARILVVGGLERPTEVVYPSPITPYQFIASIDFGASAGFFSAFFPTYPLRDLG